MKKSGMFLISIIIALLLFNTGCGTAEISFVWNMLAGGGSYSETNDTSSISLEGIVLIEQPNVLKNPLYVEIVYWVYVIREGDTDLFMIDQFNSSSVLGTSLNISSRTYQYLWVNIESTLPYPGDMYSGNNPDNVLLYLVIRDDNGTEYELTNTTNFEFTRN